ncbi:MAG: anti-sigma factor [Ferruginibacter sp.]|nr:anti-sigma factor [Ferruginibacter sp.]
MELKNIISSGLLELYVLGMANEQEIAQMTAMAKQHPELEAEIVSIESSLETYARLDAVSPSANIKEHIFAEINGLQKAVSVSPPPAPAKIIGISSFWKYAAAAFIILFLGSAVLSANYFRKYGTAHDELVAANGKLSNIQNEKASLEEQLLALQLQDEEMKDKWKVQPVALDGLPDAPGAKAKILWMKNTGDVYIDPSNLPAAPDGMQYQFWGIVNGKPVDGGLITTKSGTKYNVQKMKTFGKAEAFAVTLETMGGNPQPKGKMFVLGKM